MEVIKQVKVHVLIELTQEEATWLKGVMQNPLFGETPAEEDPKAQAIRHSLFVGLNQELIEVEPCNRLS